MLFSVLPQNKTGYNSYRKIIPGMFVIGMGRFSGTDRVLGASNMKPDFSFPSSPVFAIGAVQYEKETIDIIIHQENEMMIEYDIDPVKFVKLQNESELIRKWNYSEWNPGDMNPEDGSVVREVDLIRNKFVLVISGKSRKIWLYDYQTGVNHFIPLTNFFNELMGVKKIRDPKIALNPNNFFNDHKNYSDAEIRLAFISYNHYMNRFNIEFAAGERTDNDKKKKKIFKFIKG